jgi:hypothetical protein
MVRRAFQEADAMLSGSLPVLVGTLVRIRADFPQTSIIVVTLPVADTGPCPVWLISRDGWAEIRAGAPAAIGADGQA